MSQDKSAAYAHCRRIAAAHYENFPVASRLLPRRLRDPITAIYAFARRADDLADEGSLSPEQRRIALAAQRRALHAAAGGDGASDDPVLIALGDAIRRHRLPVALLDDLLDAFERDTRQARYADVAELLDYCRQSANPVGRLLLHLMGHTEPARLHCSDALCTALQLLNMLQDLRDDLHQRERLYLPQADLERFGVSEAELAGGADSPAIDALLDHQLQRCANLLDRAGPLTEGLSGRFAIELRCIQSAARLLHRKLLSQRSRRLSHRPRIHPGDLPRILIGAIFPH